jgi:hypothetical protein
MFSSLMILLLSIAPPSTNNATAPTPLTVHNAGAPWGTVTAIAPNTQVTSITNDPAGGIGHLGSVGVVELTDSVGSNLQVGETITCIGQCTISVKPGSGDLDFTIASPNGPMVLYDDGRVGTASGVEFEPDSTGRGGDPRCGWCKTKERGVGDQ